MLTDIIDKLSTLVLIILILGYFRYFKHHTFANKVIGIGYFFLIFDRDNMVIYFLVFLVIFMIEIVIIINHERKAYIIRRDKKSQINEDHEELVK